MKYMVMMFGEASTMMETRSPEWIREMIGWMQGFNAELEASGELVAAYGLTDGSTAKTVRFQGGAPVVTDGPYAESKESLIGFWIVDVEDEARALELTSKVVAYIEGDVEVRRVGEPPEV